MQMCYNDAHRTGIPIPIQLGGFAMAGSERKIIRLNYVGMGDDFDKTQNLIYDLLVIQGYDV